MRIREDFAPGLWKDTWPPDSPLHSICGCWLHFAKAHLLACHSSTQKPSVAPTAHGMNNPFVPSDLLSFLQRVQAVGSATRPCGRAWELESSEDQQAGILLPARLLVPVPGNAT